MEARQRREVGQADARGGDKLVRDTARLGPGAGDGFAADERLPRGPELGAHETSNATLMVYRSLHSMTKGNISLRNLGGPWTIILAALHEARQASVPLPLPHAAQRQPGRDQLLPIPVLDGGHLVLLLYEGIRGKPADERVQEILTYIGLIFILSLMVFASGSISAGFRDREPIREDWAKENRQKDMRDRKMEGKMSFFDFLISPFPIFCPFIFCLLPQQALLIVPVPSPFPSGSCEAPSSRARSSRSRRGGPGDTSIHSSPHCEASSQAPAGAKNIKNLVDGYRLVGSANDRFGVLHSSVCPSHSKRRNPRCSMKSKDRTSAPLRIRRSETARRQADSRIECCQRTNRKGRRTW